MFLQKRFKTGGSVTCVFTEIINDYDWTEFRPVQKTNWFLGFTRNGEPKRTDRCRPGSRSVQFMKRQLPDTPESDENQDLQQIMDLLKTLNLDPQKSNS